MTSEDHFEAASELYEIFILEALSSDTLNAVVEHVMTAETKSDAFRGAWLTAATWMISNAHRMKQITELSKKKHGIGSN